MMPFDVMNEINKMIKNYQLLRDKFNKASTKSKIGTICIIGAVGVIGFEWVVYQAKSLLLKEKQAIADYSKTEIEIEATKKKMESVLTEERNIMVEKFQSISKSQDAARKVCKDWTNTSCSSSEDYLIFARKYARIVAIDAKWFE
jgi:hypothetical protein